MAENSGHQRCWLLKTSKLNFPENNKATSYKEKPYEQVTHTKSCAFFCDDTSGHIQEWLSLIYIYNYNYILFGW